VIRDRPDFAQAFEGLGIAQVESGEYRNALSNLERARALGSLNPALLNYQAVALGYVGNFKTAIQLYRQALELKPDYGAARLNLAMAYQKTGDREAARREFKLLCDSGSALCRQYRSEFESSPE
jgi:Flp pilus assembly protein TadD